MKHTDLLDQATLAILKVYTDQSVCYDVTRESLIELKNFIVELIKDVEKHL